MIRPAAPTDMPFVYSSWLQNQRPLYRWLPDDVFYRHFHNRIERLIRAGAAIVSCNDEDPDQIFGYAVFTPGRRPAVIHFVYVKTAFRGLGFAKQLVKHVNPDARRTAVITTTPMSRSELKKWVAEYRPE